MDAAAGLNVLILEDRVSDADLMVHELRRAGLVFEHTIVDSKESFLQALEGCRPDIILADYSLPQFTALEALALTREVCKNLPFIIVSGSIEEETAVEAMKAGASDYLLKDRLVRLPAAVSGALDKARTLREMQKSEDALRASEKKYRLLFERNLAGVFRTTLNGRILQCNDSFARILGFSSANEISEKEMNDFFFRTDRRQSFLTELRQDRVLTNYETTLKRKDGNPVRVLENVSLVFDEDLGEEILEGTIIDVTGWKEAEERLDYLTNYDALTGLPNRTLFLDRLEQSFIDASRREHHVAVLNLDLDRFQTINDTMGHEIGNKLLQKVAGRLASVIHSGDTVARLGGDDFIFCLREISDVENIAGVARRILSVFEKPFLIHQVELFVTASIGIGVYPLDDSSSQNLLKYSEMAMYKAKQRGGSSYEFYKAEMNTVLLRKVSMENSLRRAIERNELLLLYQPKIDLQTGRVVGSEALVRWMHPELGLLSPAQFIPLAEETGCISALGEWVLREACRQNAVWHKEFSDWIDVSVNISAQQFLKENFPDLIRDILKETGMDPGYLDLEITETILMESTEDSLRRLGELKSLNLRISIDDFGTGFSSLNYLKVLPIDKLKIDGSFVRGVPQDSNDCAITRAIIALAKSLKQRVIAEGVETKEQCQFLRLEGCDEVQGFLFSHPLAPEEFEEFVRFNLSGEMTPLEEASVNPT